MRFFNANFITVLLSALLISACSSFEQAQQQKDVVTSSQTAVAKNEAEQLIPSDPSQRLALELQALPNKYLMKGGAEMIPAVAQNQFEQGIALIKQQQLTEAHTLFLAMSQQYPSLSGSWVNLADIAQLQGNRQQAIDYLRSAISCNDTNYLAHNRLAMLYRQEGQFNLALQHYNLALESWPAFTKARLNRGILHDLYLGNKTQALEDYEVYQALLTEPDRQVKGWIADLERQVQAQEKAYNETSGTIKGEVQ